MTSTTTRREWQTFTLDAFIEQIGLMNQRSGQSILLPLSAANDLAKEASVLQAINRHANQHETLCSLSERASALTNLESDIVISIIFSILEGRTRGVGDIAACNRILQQHNLNQFVSRHRNLIEAANSYSHVLAQAQSHIRNRLRTQRR